MYCTFDIIEGLVSITVTALIELLPGLQTLVSPWVYNANDKVVDHELHNIK